MAKQTGGGLGTLQAGLAKAKPAGPISKISEKSRNHQTSWNKSGKKTFSVKK